MYPRILVPRRLVRPRASGTAVVQAAASMPGVARTAASTDASSARPRLSSYPLSERSTVAMATVDLSLNGYDESRGRALEASVLAAVRATPGIEAAAWTTAVPLALGRTSRRGTRIRGYIAQPGEDLEFPFAVVSPEYFATLQVPLVRGRPFADTDQTGSPGVVIVSEAFARRFWPGRNPLEQAVSVQGDQGPWLAVVGVARDGKYQSLGETPQPFLYFPLAQEYWPVLTLVARTSGEPAAAERAVRAAFQAADRDLPVFNAQTLGDHLALTTLPQRIAQGLRVEDGQI